MLSYDTCILVAWATATDGFYFPLYKIIALRSTFEESMNCHQSGLVLLEFPIKFVTYFMSSKQFQFQGEITSQLIVAITKVAYSGFQMK